MFVQLAQVLQNPYDVFSFHPLQLQALLDAAWEGSRHRFVRSPADFGPEIHDAGISGPLNGDAPGLSLSDALMRVLHGPYVSGPLGGETFANAVGRLAQRLSGPGLPRPWHHLIYAYLVENTGIFEVFARILSETLHGEKLGSISEQGHRFLRTSEQLFFNDPGFSFISSIQSSIRPDVRATRRNAYYRMFGIDLNHGMSDGRPYEYVKAEANNRDFVKTFAELLREIWRGHVNSSNTSGPNTTDDAVIADHAQRLEEMLNERRINSNLAREEYVAVATMAWFHLAISTPNSPIVSDLKADAVTPEARLRKLGERVGITVHSKTRSLLRLGELASVVLIEIERGTFSDPAAAPLLYDPSVPNNIAADTLTIIEHWALATGFDPKAIVVSAAG
jgi:hypothetical protein